MADGIELNSGSGGATLATDDVSGTHYQLVKLADGTADSTTVVAAGTGVEANALRVTIATDVALPAGTNAIGKLAANSGVDIGDVDVTTVVPGTGATNLGKAEDAAHSSGDTGVMALAVRNDVLASLAGSDGDYAPLQVNQDGALWTVTSADAGTRDIFQRSVTASPFNDIDVQFFEAAPSGLIQVTTANSATATANVGGALFSSSTNANGSVQGVTVEKTTYTAGSEVYALFTAAFTAGIANSYMRIGLFDANNGFFLGYEGTSFGLTVRNNAVDGAQITAFSEDALDGGATSLFTRGGTPEAIDYTQLNIFRIRFGWLGSAPVFWEVMAPDGHWVTFHKILYPNLQAVPSIRSANLPMTIDITKTAAAATDLTIQTDCWGAGTIGGIRSADADEFAFQTTATLTNGASYNSGILSLSPEFSQVQTSVLADQNGTITISWYSDAAGTDTIRTLTITYTASNDYQLFAAPAFSPYVRYVFANDSGSNQTDFYFDTKFMRRPLNPQILRLDGPLSGGMVAQVNRAVITAYNGSTYQNVTATTGGNLKVSLQEASDGLDIGAGNAGTETIRVSVASDDVNLSAIKTAVELIDNAIAGSEMQVDIVSGTVTANLSATDNTVLDNIDTSTTAAQSMYRNIDANAEAEIKGSAGTLHWLHVMNLTAAKAYVHLYNDTAANVTPGTTTPNLTFPIPTQGDTNGAGFTLPLGPTGQRFSTGITLVVTTTIDGSAGDPGTNGVFVNAGYT